MSGCPPLSFSGNIWTSPWPFQLAHYQALLHSIQKCTGSFNQATRVRLAQSQRMQESSGPFEYRLPLLQKGFNRFFMVCCGKAGI
jgi:hypothetical protein